MKLTNPLSLVSVIVSGALALPSPTTTSSDVDDAICTRLPNPLPSASSLPIIPALPDPFTFFDGRPVRSPFDWACRKAELKTIVQEYLYGYYPDHSLEHVTAHRVNNTVTVEVRKGAKVGNFTTTLAFPGNLTEAEMRRHPVPVVINAGGVDTNVFLGSGVALATFDVTTVAMDSTVQQGAFWDLYAGEDIGVLTSWAWGFHRILDALIQVAPEIDAKRVGVTGCSRYGKAALAAGIFDERITLTLAMSSGIEGVGPWRFFFEQFGANEKINNIFGFAPYWSTSRLGQFVNDSRQLPFDAHLQAALVAPRALIWDEGEVDYWTNPQGEASVTYVATEAVYKFLGVGENVGVAIRNSAHCDISGYANIKDFMNRVFFGTPTTRNYSDISPYTPFTEAFPWINDAPSRV